MVKNLRTSCGYPTHTHAGTCVDFRIKGVLGGIKSPNNKQPACRFTYLLKEMQQTQTTLRVSIFYIMCYSLAAACEYVHLIMYFHLKQYPD